jgi:hypothetical protein
MTPFTPRKRAALASACVRVQRQLPHHVHLGPPRAASLSCGDRRMWRRRAWHAWVERGVPGIEEYAALSSSGPWYAARLTDIYGTRARYPAPWFYFPAPV